MSTERCELLCRLFRRQKVGEELLRPLYELFGTAVCFQRVKFEPVIQSRDRLHTGLPPFSPQRL